MSVQTHEETGAVRLKLGHEARVSVAEQDIAPEGPMVQVTHYVTADAYPVSDTRTQKQYLRGARKGYRGPVTKSDGYVGPYRHGFWLSPEAAYALAELIVQAAIAAESRRMSDEGVSA